MKRYILNLEPVLSVFPIDLRFVSKYGPIILYNSRSKSKSLSTEDNPAYGITLRRSQIAQTAKGSSVCGLGRPCDLPAIPEPTAPGEEAVYETIPK